jgi:preprotein translocase subunit SecA
MPDLATELVGIDNGEGSDDQKLEKKQQLMQDYGVKSARIHSMNQLLKAYTLFEKDIEYVVMENKVKIVDEQTGRIMDGRRYSDGLHQAIEAKEGVKVEAATQTYATVTLQNYFRMYHKLAGMTGTAETEAGELWEIYELDVMVIPTNRPIARADKDDLVYKTKREKLNAVIEDVVELSNQGRPVLVGTTTVEISELLSKMLGMRSIKHQVLNAKMHQREAEVVAEAGKPGTVTIATNMAGRGTDIKLSKEVKDSGGLAIVGTERHDSRRVDRQLRGRSGRQGDPGSSQFYVSLEDDLMRLFGSERVSKMMDRMGHQEGEVIQAGMITKSIERAQKKVEENNFGIRKRLLEYDDVMNAQREVIYKRRRNALYGDRIRTDIANMFYELVEAHVLSTHPDKDSKATAWPCSRTLASSLLWMPRPLPPASPRTLPTKPTCVPKSCTRPSSRTSPSAPIRSSNASTTTPRTITRTSWCRSATAARPSRLGRTSSRVCSPRAKASSTRWKRPLCSPSSTSTGRNTFATWTTCAAMCSTRVLSRRTRSSSTSLSRTSCSRSWSKR